MSEAAPAAARKSDSPRNGNLKNQRGETKKKKKKPSRNRRKKNQEEKSRTTEENRIYQLSIGHFCFQGAEKLWHCNEVIRPCHATVGVALAATNEA